MVELIAGDEEKLFDVCLLRTKAGLKPGLAVLSIAEAKDEPTPGLVG